MKASLILFLVFASFKANALGKLLKYEGEVRIDKNYPPKDGNPKIVVGTQISVKDKYSKAVIMFGENKVVLHKGEYSIEKNKQKKSSKAGRNGMRVAMRVDVGTVFVHWKKIKFDDNFSFKTPMAKATIEGKKKDKEFIFKVWSPDKNETKLFVVEGTVRFTKKTKKSASKYFDPDSEVTIKRGVKLKTVSKLKKDDEKEIKYELGI